LECQRERHADRCRQWHEHNREHSIDHYEDVVEPFRRRQPSYQRRWRWARGLREIRETMGALLDVLGARLEAVISRGRALSAEAATEQQTRVISGASLSEVLAVATAITVALEQVGFDVRQLEAAGL
jgi:hypothetical protein